LLSLHKEGRATTSSMVSATRGCRSSTASCEGVCVALKSPLARGSGGLQPTKHLGSATAAYRTWRSSMWRSAGCATQKSSLETTCVKHTGTCYGASRILGASLRCRRCSSARTSSRGDPFIWRISQPFKGSAVVALVLPPRALPGRAIRAATCRSCFGRAGLPTNSGLAQRSLRHRRLGRLPHPSSFSPCSPTSSRPLLDGEPISPKGALLSVLFEPMPVMFLFICRQVDPAGVPPPIHSAALAEENRGLDAHSEGSARQRCEAP
jgi:hypothetical protein